MKHYTDKLKEFNKAFNIPTSKDITTPRKLRYDLLKEENLEYLHSLNGAELIDAVGDILYIAIGTIVEHGLEHHIKEIFDIIHYSNMSKLDDNRKPIINGENGANDPTRPIGKVLKSRNFKEPDFYNVIKELELIRNHKNVKS